jgi:hypothetical protein
VPDDVAAGVAAFTRRLGADSALLGMDFVVGARGWWFAGVGPWPDLRVGGEDLCSRLLDLLAPNGRAQRIDSTIGGRSA